MQDPSSSPSTPDGGGSPSPGGDRARQDRAAERAVDATYDRRAADAGATETQPSRLAAPAGDEAPPDLFADAIARLSSRRGSFARYQVRGEVARGGMGLILRVRDEDLHRDLAMKVILPRSDDSPSGSRTPVEWRALGRFLEEAQVTGQLDHPGIVPVHEIGLDSQGRVYFTMRLVAGRDLEKILELAREGKEGWTNTRAVGVILKVCEALAYAHDKGVIHRDLKPANVMVGRFGEVYVMDWGLARVLARPESRDVRLRANHAPSTAMYSSLQSARELGVDSSLVTMDGDVVGTPAYMSPEQARGEIQTTGPATDIYAVGAILYHLLAGRAPYLVQDGPNDAIAVWRRVVERAPASLRERAVDAHPELIAITEKAMAREPGDRYATMLDMAEDLQAYLEGRVVRAYESGAMAEVRKWILRNRALAWTIAVAAVVILIGSATAALILVNKNEELVAANDGSRRSEARAIENAKLAQENEHKATENAERANANEKKATENADLAHQNELKATQNAQLAEERAARILRLSDSKRLEQLEKTAATLWPAIPANVPRYESWLKEARELVLRLPEHESTLEELRRRALPAEAGAKDSAPMQFEHAEDRWQHDNQQELVANLRAFADPKTGRIADIEKRLEFARSIEDRTVTGAEARAHWAEAISSISNRTSCPQYGGLVIRAQLGLLPIARDPRSGLWEFAHLQSGAPPVRDARTEKLAMTEESGLVLVLLPGGTFAMGAQSADAKKPNYDPRAEAKESPVNNVTLAPFFMSKYEMTQGQWMRFTGKNPSLYNPLTEVGGVRSDLSHPVEQVSWNECSDVLDELGLELPTEAQWEYAARSGTTTPWWTGGEKESLEGAANLADQAAARAGATWPGIADWPELDDGFGVHAPVGSFRASPFGLHDMLGNVWEWCRDSFGNYDSPVKEGDGERTPTDKRFRINRGGSFYHDAAHARCAYRNNSVPETRINHLGVRPARALEK
jgi:formylglycine-generating enzyme required for sulfatase activity/serine/threonine protein kinase